MAPETRSLPFSARDTVAIDTPAAAATSCSVTDGFLIRTSTPVGRRHRRLDSQDKPRVKDYAFRRPRTDTKK
ncbi:protein of unknown function [Microbacterium sp. Nx66]|nr:protein of unknown function [Microbacterium sp. Nx66]